MRFDLAGGWYLQRVDVDEAHEWIVCDPAGDRLGDTPKHKAELDAALVSGVPAITRLKLAKAQQTAQADMRSAENVKLRQALAKLSNEVLGSMPLLEVQTRRDLGNSNYNILIQRAEEARALLTAEQTLNSDKP